MELWSELRSTLDTVLSYPNTGACWDHSREVRTHQLSSECAFALQGKPKGARVPARVQNHSGAFSVFALSEDCHAGTTVLPTNSPQAAEERRKL